RAAAAAVVAAAAQLGVEGVKDVGADRADLLAPDQRADVLVDVAAVGGQGGAFGLNHLQVPVEQLVQRGVGTRVPLLPNLGEQPSLGGLGQVLAAWSTRDDLSQVVAA